jgi:hypothetical protein
MYSYYLLSGFRSLLPHITEEKTPKGYKKSVEKLTFIAELIKLCDSKTAIGLTKLGNLSQMRFQRILRFKCSLSQSLEKALDFLINLILSGNGLSNFVS